MADELISFPFRIDRQGHVAGTPYGSDREVDEAIAQATMTEIGERPLFPGYGIPAPAFHGLYASDIQSCLDDYGPADVTITTVDAEPASPTESVATISWERDDSEEIEDEL
ncbi:hypothetical protein [Zhihengliuella halotolerans]|uniref:hypothetical protein n=1 Tax=Zhihengliuella halotolerans TaxID=370736 RepID=UPI000C801A96|nr:hypothetical protein [Zhihengliuella halotolerans]